MRSFKAKVLRRIAEKQTIGRPAHGGYHADRHGSAVVAPFTTRKVYKLLKRHFDIKEVMKA